MLNDFDFCSYTHFVFGRDSERKAGEMIAKDGGIPFLLFTAPESTSMQTVCSIM